MSHSRPIQIYSIVSKGAVFFDGSTVAPKFLGTVEASLHPTISNRIVIVRNDRTYADGVTFRKLFRKLNPGRVQNEQGEDLMESLGYSINDVVDYINGQSQATDTITSGATFQLGETLDFTRDETDTSILFSNGDHHGINAIKAIAKDNGKLGIYTIRGDVELYEIDHTDVTIKGDAPVSTTIEGVVNELNAFFTLSAVGGITAKPVYTQLEGEDISWIAAETHNPTGPALYGNPNSGTSYHGPRVYTAETINEPGEYFTFEASNAVAGGGPLFGIGLYSVANGDLDEVTDNSLSNSATHGYFFSNWLYNYSGYSAPWTTYGSHSSLSYGPGWTVTDKMFRYSDANDAFRDGGNALFKCGITDEGFVGIWYYDIEVEGRDLGYGARSNDWILLARSASPVPEGEFGLMVKIPTTSGRIMSQPKRFATDAAAPTLFYRYIESPDGVFHYPLFASEEEANYIDSQNGGSGTSSTIVFPDESTQTAWYKPETGYTDNGASAPSDTNTITWTEILSLNDAAMAPSAYFSPFVQSFTEGTAINIQLAPQDVGYTTTTTGAAGLGLTTSATGLLQGNLPYVTADTTYTINVIRTNTYGSSTGQLQLEILDNPAASEIAGWTTIQGNTQAPDVVLRSENAVLEYDVTISPGQEVSWPHENYSTMGFLSAVGESVKTTNNIAAETNAWEVQFTPWSNGNLNHLSYYGIGWDDNSLQGSPSGTWSGGTWKMVYETGGTIVVYFNDVEYLRSVATYSGAKTLVYATHNSYSVDTTVPTVAVIDTVFTGGPPTGFTQEHGSMDDSTTLSNGGVVTLDATLPVGKRMLVNKSWVEANALPVVPDALNKAYIGVPAPDAAWGSIDLHLDFDAVMRWEGSSNNTHKTTLADGSDIVARHESNVGSLTDAYYHYAIEWDGTNLTVLADPDISKFSTEHDKYQFARYSCYENYSEQSGALPLVMACKGGGNVILSMTGISFIDIPAAPVTILTPWTKALDFSGSSERAMQSSNITVANTMKMNGLSVTTSEPASGLGTSSDGDARPWATACVFRPDMNNSNQHIWNCGEGNGGDNIYLRLSAAGSLFFGWGRPETNGALNECRIATGLNANSWYGVYVGHNGTRYSSGQAVKANLATAFDIRLKEFNATIPDIYWAQGNLAATTDNWTTSGGRMDRAFSGDLTIGGRGSNRSFHGKVASFVSTTLRRSHFMPDATEIEMMIEDPKKWEQDYRVGQVVRNAGSGGNTGYTPANIYAGYLQTQMWLMGDGSLDNYSNMIRNEVYNTEQNYTKLNLISMVSNDIQTVSIPGLTS